jgi:hypothetical protein
VGVWEAAAAAASASGRSGGGASMLFDELSRPSIWETNLYCLRHKFRKV